jgi:hypothetical protein
MRAIQDGSVKFCAHHRIIVEGMAKSVGVAEEEMRGHLTYMPGLLDLLAIIIICGRLGEDILHYFGCHEDIKIH